MKLPVFINEFCFDGSCNVQDENVWKEQLRRFLKIALKVIEERKEMFADVVFYLPRPGHQMLCGSNSFFAILKDVAEKRDEYRYLVTRLKEHPGYAGEHDFDVYYQGKISLSMGFASMPDRHLPSSWVFSLPWGDGEWEGLTINATKFHIEDNNVVDTPCEVKQISTEHHASHYSQDIRDWGRIVNSSCYIHEIDGKPIVMWMAPLEHEPPHIHLLSGRSSNKTLAKYRIDIPERISGLDNWDGTVLPWIIENKQLLLASWQRCQRGMHPYAVH